MIQIVDLGSDEPVFHIPGDMQKSGEDLIAPMAPEFAEFLRAVPGDDREGFVFNPLTQRYRENRILMQNASDIISDIGEAAGVVVNQKGKGKFASAHDLRRSFGERWAP